MGEAEIMVGRRRARDRIYSTDDITHRDQIKHMGVELGEFRDIK